MRIYVDRQRENVDFPPGLSLWEIIDRITSQGISDNRVITHIKVNGQELLEDENGLYPDMGSDEIDSLELETSLPREMAHQGLEDARKYLQKLNPGIEKTAELFRLGEESKANAHYGHCIDGINWFMQILEGVRQVLGLNFQGISFKGKSVQVYIQKQQEIIRQMWRVQVEEDWVMLSDLLEYELLPIMEAWKEILPLLEEKARNSGEGLEKHKHAKKKQK